jgi:peptidoglycan/LPS O-acetylase OafA/YrhL
MSHKSDVQTFNYRPDIDGLRALAILLVVIFHAYPKFLRGGFVGVDIFFVISGYLITSIIFKGLSEDKFSLLDFYSRRIKRIFPSLITVLIFCLVAGWFILLDSEYEFLGKHVAAGATYISNFILYRESGYFDIDSQLKPLLHLWSLSIEEQFYLVFPLILIVAARARFNFLILISILFLMSFGLNIFQGNISSSKAFFFPHTRFWELLFGSAVAYVNFYTRSNFDLAINYLFSNKSMKFTSNLLAWTGFLLIFLAWIGFNCEKITYPSGWALVPTIGAALLILAGEKAWLNKKFFSSKTMVGIGLISYPLYLWHWPLLSFTHIVQMEKPSSTLRFMVLVLSFLLAWMTYFFIERNLRYRKHWLVPAVLLVSLLIVGFLGYQIFTNKGYPERIAQIVKAPEDIGLKPWEENGWVKQDACLKKFGNFEFCLMQDNMRPITAVLIGDSHANHFYPGLVSNVNLTGGNLLNLGVGACLHFVNNSNDVIANQEKNCQSLVNRAIKEAINNPSVHRVFLGGIWSGYLKQKKRVVRKFFGQKLQDKAANFEQSMRDTLQVLFNANKLRSNFHNGCFQFRLQC